jgi:alanine dehydrogenase
VPTLYLTEDEVRSLLTMDLAVEAVEAGLRKMALEEAYKAYVTGKFGARFRVTIYDGKTGEMLAILQADYLGQMRTGAASAVATKHLARPDAATVGIFGAGKQARTQLLGVSRVRKLSKAVVYSPTAERRSAFAAEMSAACGVEVIPTDRPEAAARGMDIICTATSAREPVLFGEWISPGQHLNVAGSNFLGKTEIDVEVVRKANVVAIDSKDQGRSEAGDFAAALDKDVIQWSDVAELGRIVAKRTPGRESPNDVTLFKSLGLGLEDIAVAIKVYQTAKEAGVGKWLDL